MGSFLVRRLFFAASLVVAVSFAAFAIFGISFDPGFGFLMSNQAIDHRKHAYMVHHYHLHGPILSRYWHWLSGVVHHGSFGSMVSLDIGGVPMRILTPGAPITPIVVRALEVTSILVGTALVFVVLGSTFVGALAAHRSRYRGDLWVRGLVYLGAAAPTFLVADLLQKLIIPKVTVVFANGGYHATSTSSWFQPGPPQTGVESWAQHLILPALALSIGLIGIYSRYVRTAMLTELGRPYIAVARAKGLSELRVVIRHALRNSLVPFTSLLSLEMGGVIGASLAADGVFGAGGLATAFLQAVGTADPFLLTAIFSVTALMVCGFAFVGDFLVGLLDPRMELARQ